LGAGYNGSRKGALHRDFLFQGDDDKGKWVLHAEQNVFMFRCTDDTSKCTLYSTHSPCLQCSGIIREKHVQKVYFLEAYRAPPDLLEDDLCHQVREIATRPLPIESLATAITEVKRGYPVIKQRLGTGYGALTCRTPFGNWEVTCAYCVVPGVIKVRIRRGMQKAGRRQLGKL
jgi:hypothetical protein